MSARIAVRAPGRANLIGEHTDYNDGFVLPVALELETRIRGERDDGDVILRSLQQPGEVVVDTATGTGPERGWGRYVAAVVRALLDHGLKPLGVRGVVDSTVPLGAGLSSSAALEVAVALAVLDASPGPVELAEICRRAENAYVGVASGIMDQLASAGAVAGHALFVDCGRTTMVPVPVPPGLTVLLVHCGMERILRLTAYNDRREECQRAAAALAVPSLRDATLGMLEEAGDGMEEVLYRRARHVLTENARVEDAVRALETGDLPSLRDLFAASHESLTRDYEVSTPELDALVEIALRTEGVVAARMTGAGFGGCTVNLVHADAAQEAAAAVTRAYEVRTGRHPRHWISAPAAGAGAADV